MNLFDLVVTIGADTTGAENAISETRQSVETASTTIGAKAVVIGNAIYDMGKKAADGLVSVGKYALDVGMSFDSSMANVAAISGATGEDLDDLRSKAKEMGASTKFSATEAADAFGYMAMAGWKTSDMLDGIEGVMNLAAASGEDLATTSDIVTDAMTAFGMEAGEAGRFADVLATASSNANTNVAMMGETFKYVAPVAGTLGYTVEDVAVGIGLMANSGIKAGQAGTSLRAALSRMVDPTEAVWDAIGGLGLALTDTTDDFQGVTNNLGEYNAILYNNDGSTKTFAETLGTLRDAFSGLSEGEQMYYATNLFGQEAMSGMLAMINASEEDFNNLTEAIENSNGSAEEMARIMNDNLPGAVTKFKSATEGLGIAIYEQFSDTLKDVVSYASSFIGEITALVEEDGLEGLLTAFTTFAPKMVDVAVEWMSSLGEYLKDNLPVLMESGLKSAVAFTDSLRENAGKVVDGAIALAKGLAKGLADSIPTIVENVPTIVSNIANIINDNAPKMLAAAAVVIATLVKGLLAAIPTIIQNMPKIIAAIWDTITAVNWINLGGTIIKGIGSGIKSMVGFAKESITTIKNALHDGISTLPSTFADIGRNMIQGLINGVKSMASAAVQNAKSIGTSMVSGVKSVLGIHSPSRVFAEIGNYMVMGLEQGWDEKFSGVKSDIMNGMDFDTAKIGVESSVYSKSQSTLSGLQTLGNDINIIVQSVLDGKVIGETAYKYNLQRQRSMGV